MQDSCLVQVLSSKNRTVVQNPLIPPTLNKLKPQKNIQILWRPKIGITFLFCFALLRKQNIYPIKVRLDQNQTLIETTS
jgi:hypothetical protein